MCRQLFASLFLVLCGVGATTLAGPLNPPSGPVAPSYKTLQEVEPRIPINATNTPGSGTIMYMISQPGSYYLTGNINVPYNWSGIGITSNNVTIDLNGYSILGTLFTGTGITYVDSTRDANIHIANGFVSQFATGIDLHTMDQGMMEDVDVFACPTAGFMPPDASQLTRCRATNCGTGFKIPQESVVNDCYAAWNTADGFAALDGVATFSRCRSEDNTGNGFIVGQIPGSSTLDHSYAYSNHATNFNLGADTSATFCTSAGSIGVGIYASARCRIEDCTAYYSHVQGIEVLSDCTIARCRTWSNGTSFAGVWINGNGNRVEDNESNANGYGYYISASATGNFLVRNTAHSNSTNFNSGWVTTSNNVAPIVTNPGANGFASMTPWSNIAY